VNAGLNLTGYSLLGPSGADGIRYTWQIAHGCPLVESAAFNCRAKIPVSHEDRAVSAYTTSVSAGCALSARHLACRFCRTGQALRYSGPLSSKEISLQNVLMVLMDTECEDHPDVCQNQREFAYMGQGEPGFAYSQLREAIRLTDRVMTQLDQRVFRHIIASSGVPEMIDSLLADLTSGFYGDTRITFHFSLHAADGRHALMPIERLYSHRDVIPRLTKLYETTGDKPCVGIMLFKNLALGARAPRYSTNSETLEKIASLLDPKCHRISLCEYNEWGDLARNDPVTPAEAAQMAELLKSHDFEVKLFASFGKRENTACGLLGGTSPTFEPGGRLQSRYQQARRLVERMSTRR